MAGTHFKEIYDDDIAKVYGPHNIHLLDSLLSGFPLKYELTSSPEMYGFIDDGLELPRGSGDSESELFVVGTCIQLI